MISWSFSNGHYEIKTHYDRPELSHLFHLDQTHSADVHSLNSLIDAAPEILKGDGIYGKITDLKNNQPAIRTADCLPIFILNHNSWAALHAGWRGLEQKIIHNQTFDFPALEAVIGPCIRPCCFEVSEDFQTHFPHRALLKTSQGLRFDLLAEAEDQLRTRWPRIKIHQSGLCTHCEPNMASFRRDKTTIRHWNVLSQKID